MNKIKFIVSGVAGSMLLMSLAPAAMASTGTKTINFAFWGSDTEAAAIKQTVAAFEKTHPSIKVTETWIQANYDQKLLTEIAGGTAPDVMLISNSDMPGFTQSFSPISINPKIYSSKKIYDNMNFQGKEYAYPFIVKPKVMVINVSMFKKAHLPLPSLTKPMTPQQFQKDAMKLTHGSGKSEVFGSAPLWYGDWLYEFGGQFFNKNGTKSEIGSKAAIDAANFVIDSSAKYGYAPTAKEAQGQDTFAWFVSGKEATYTDLGPWDLPLLKSIKNFDWEVVPDPGFTTADTPEAEVDGLAISNTSSDPKDANIFAKYLSTSSVAQNILASSPSAIGVPVIASAVPGFVKAQKGRNLEAFVLSAERAPTIGTPAHNSSQLNGETWTELNNDTAIGTGNQAPNVALPKIAQNIDEMIH